MSYPKLHALSVVHVPQGERFLSRTCQNCGPGKRLAHTSWARRPGTPKWTSRSKTIRDFKRRILQSQFLLFFRQSTQAKTKICVASWFSNCCFRNCKQCTFKFYFQKASGSRFSSSPRQSDFFPTFFFPQIGAFELGQIFQKLEHSSWEKFLKNKKLGAWKLGQSLKIWSTNLETHVSIDVGKDSTPHRTMCQTEHRNPTHWSRSLEVWIYQLAM